LNQERMAIRFLISLRLVGMTEVCVLNWACHSTTRHSRKRRRIAVASLL